MPYREKRDKKHHGLEVDMLQKKLTVLVLSMLVFAIPVSGLFLQPIKTEAKSVFSDIENHWAKETILWAVERGIVKGYPDGTFRPNNHVTEAQFLAMLIRAYHPEIQSEQIVHWADSYYTYAMKMNYPLLGDRDLPVRDKPINRLRVAELISASQGVHYEEHNAIRYLLGQGLATGRDPNHVTISNFDPYSYLTRAQAVQFIKNVVEKGKGGLLARPQQYSDTSLLPDIPLGIEYDLPYKPPVGWVPPKIKSVATDDYDENRKILEEELGLIYGEAYDPYYNNINNARIIIGKGTSNHIAQIEFLSWKYGIPEEEHPANKIPYVARELFKFYLPNEYNKLFKIMDDGFNGKDVSKYVKRPFTLDGREIKIVELERSVTVIISKKGKSVD